MVCDILIIRFFAFFLVLVRISAYIGKLCVMCMQDFLKEEVIGTKG